MAGNLRRRVLALIERFGMPQPYATDAETVTINLYVPSAVMTEAERGAMLACAARAGRKPD